MMIRPTYEEVKETIGTPAYVFDTDCLRERVKTICTMLGENVRLCYAMKANSFIIEALQDVIDRYEVCSPGEFRICERAELPMEQIVLSGVYKAPHDIARVVAQYGAAITYTAESVRQFHLLHEEARKNNVCIRVLLRVTSGNQFGMEESELCELVEKRARYPHIEIVGIQHFSGTQRRRLSMYEEELRYVDELIARLEREYGYQAKELEFGPGFYVEYFQHAKAYEEAELLEGFRSLLAALRFKGVITLELGRFIAASCGTYYTEIVDRKHNGEIDFCIVNGGMHQIQYFGQMMAMKHPYYRQLRRSEEPAEEKPCNISGSLCTVNDNLVKNLPLRDPQIGDILEFQNTGAYCATEGISLFLSRDLPRVYLYSQEKGLKRMRDTFETDVLNYKQ